MHRAGSAREISSARRGACTCRNYGRNQSVSVTDQTTWHAVQRQTPVTVFP